MRGHHTISYDLENNCDVLCLTTYHFGYKDITRAKYMAPVQYTCDLHTGVGVAVQYIHGLENKDAISALDRETVIDPSVVIVQGHGHVPAAGQPELVFFHGKAAAGRRSSAHVGEVVCDILEVFPYVQAIHLNACSLGQDAAAYTKAAEQKMNEHLSCGVKRGPLIISAFKNDVPIPYVYIWIFCEY